MMHGKSGAPTRYADWVLELERRGYLVIAPEMCWSGLRRYDRPYPECLTEIDTAIAGLRNRGARSIVLAGNSMGGTAAINYAATHDGIAGVIGLAASDSIWARLPPDIQDSVDRARDLVAQGKGDTVKPFADLAAGQPLTMQTTATNYLSFLAPESQVMTARAAQLRAPLLMVAGLADPYTSRYQEIAFQRIPDYALNRFVTVSGDHNKVPTAAEPAMLQWLGDIAKER